MPRGQAELVTTFEVDANGLLKVSAMDRASGRKASISTFTSIQPTLPVSYNDIQASLTLLAVSHPLRSTR